ncbi:response regulator transcription factor [soil metagenome]|nr:response regulator transcription factor [Trueperaceae bacterium]
MDAADAPRILIVEDDPDIVQVVRAYLEGSGYAVDVAGDGRAGLSCALTAPPALIVLDWMLPSLDGLEFMRILRRTSAVPVIMLTARIEESDRILGLEFGVDDYVTKPFSPRELVARVRAVLRRAAASDDGGEAPLERGSLHIDPGRRRVCVVGEDIEVTAREFDLLHTLALRPGRVFRREELLDRVWGSDADVVDRVVDVHVSNLRRKLDAHPASAGAIVTMRGVGYAFREDRA